MFLNIFRIRNNLSVQIKIIDDESRLLESTKIGEICCKPKALFSGYFGEPEKTAETLVGRWIQTGDVRSMTMDFCLSLVVKKKL